MHYFDKKNWVGLYFLAIFSQTHLVTLVKNSSRTIGLFFLSFLNVWTALKLHTYMHVFKPINVKLD
jgi:hypothetical protein